MKFLFASDSFKGTLSSRRTAELLTLAAQEVFPGCECSSMEMADGGEGTTDAVIAAAGGSVKTAITMILASCDAEEAKARLDKARGHVREAIQ